MMRDIGKRIGGLRDRVSESLCQMDLMLAQNVQRKVARARNEIVRRTIFLDARQNERRVERDGRERVRGHAVNLGAVAHGQHGDAGQESAHHLAEQS
jgi:hypothetical protein